MVAALPIGNDCDASRIFRYLQTLLDGLLDHGIQAVSYACDGTSTECKVQEMFMAKAEEAERYAIKNPHAPDDPTAEATVLIGH